MNITTTVGDIAKFYEAHPECASKISVKTRFGFKRILAAAVTAKKSEVLKITTLCGKSIRTSPDHLMLSNDIKWTPVRSLNRNDFLFTEDGPTKISKITALKTRQDLYDLQVEEVNEYFANGLVSHNSTILDALCLALFNKPFRNVNKPQLVNSINKKDCVAEVEFRIGEKKYKVIRGIKPNKFEIYLNDELVNQDPNSRDYQSYLEEHVLKRNFKSFTQIDILGSAGFMPFMQLPAAHRRDVVENLLDINIFSLMNITLKERYTELKDNLKTVESEISIAKTKVDLQQKYIKTLEVDNLKKIEETNELIDSTKHEIIGFDEEYGKCSTNKQELESTITDDGQTRTTNSELRSSTKQEERNIAHINEQIEFYEHNENCPTCSQNLALNHKQKSIDKLKDQLVLSQQHLSDFGDELNNTDIRIKHIDVVKKQIKDISLELSSINSRKIAAESYIEKLEKEITRSSINGNTTDEKMKLKELAKDALSITHKRNELNEQKYYYDICVTLLKDGGIKTKVIKQYLPVINKLVNKYLAALDFFVSFELDENFDETIKSRHRDDFSYSSFSEGEKSKIDLSILFAWRTIAKMKNSASSNLLILDEIFDSSLDSNSTDNLMHILSTTGNDTNVFVISHNGEKLFDKFRSIIKFSKNQQGYSRIET